MRRRSAQPPHAPTAPRVRPGSVSVAVDLAPRSRPCPAVQHSKPSRLALLTLGALCAAAACRSNEAEPSRPGHGNELTAAKVRELIASGALKPIEPRPGPPLADSERAAHDELTAQDSPPNELDAAVQRILEAQRARSAGAAPVADPSAIANAIAPANATLPAPQGSIPAPVPAPAPSTAVAPASTSEGAVKPAELPSVPTTIAHALTGEPAENPYLTFGKRILVYENGLIMKPYPLRIGMGEKLLNLLKTYGNFPLYAEGAQNPDQVRLDLLKDWDQEQVSNLRAVDIEETKIQQPFKIADWLVVTARAERLKEVESFINIFAAGVPQIEIEAKIVEVTTTDVLDLGVKPVNDTTPIFGFPDQTFVQGFSYNFPNSSSVLNSILQLSTVQDGLSFNLLLQMLQTYENVSIISRPKIAVREGGIAKIINTIKLPSLNVTGIAADGRANSVVSYEEVGIKLYVVPRVVGTQTVALNIDVEASQQSGSVVIYSTTASTSTPAQIISNPIISRRAAQTVVYLEPGQAVILGGLVSERTVDTENKVPILGSIPLLGYFFKSTLKRKEQANVLFFIRPRILTGSDLNREF